MIGIILGRMEKKEWKIGEKMSGRVVWLKGGGGDKNGGSRMKVYEIFIFWDIFVLYGQFAARGITILLTIHKSIFL